MNIKNEGLRALTVADEQAEIRAIGTVKRVKLQYLKGSARMGLRLWNVLSPVEGYKSGGDNGYPTFSLPTLKAKGLI